MIRAPWVSHFGFTHTPFSKTIPASQLCERASLQEAVARIRFTIAEALLGVLTGEVGVGKTVAVRATTAQLDPASHHVIYVSNPAFGTRGLYVPLVADDAIARLHQASLGLPRALNNAAIAALIAAASAGKALVDDECAKKAVAEITRD